MVPKYLLRTFEDDFTRKMSNVCNKFTNKQ